MTTTSPDDQARRRIANALAHMPYGGLVKLPGPRFHEIDLSFCAAYLESLGEALRSVAKCSHNDVEELQRYRDAARGLRFLLGIAAEDGAPAPPAQDDCPTS